MREVRGPGIQNHLCELCVIEHGWVNKHQRDIGVHLPTQAVVPRKVKETCASTKKAVDCRGTDAPDNLRGWPEVCAKSTL